MSDCVAGAIITPLRVPKIFNLRTDPYERADITSNTYYDWLIDHSDGKISDIRLEQSSGAELNDQAILKAVEQASPASPLPADNPEYVQLRLTMKMTGPIRSMDLKVVSK